MAMPWCLTLCRDVGNGNGANMNRITDFRINNKRITSNRNNKCNNNRNDNRNNNCSQGESQCSG